ncbi:MAG: hypothetical protein LBJ31_04360 [Treponema sp.]|jgi:hypothetical protein|nr:hypothetical protein [Treponema sp.]
MNNIHYLLQEKDNIEKVRDQIAAILKSELVNQKQLAEEAALADAADYDVSVYLERGRPWELTENEQSKNPFPLINVLLFESKPTAGGKQMTAVGYTAKFNIDCYGCGNSDIDGEGEMTNGDDSAANIRAWKTGRLARNILMSAFYYYLGLRGIVKKTYITEIKTGTPDNLPESAAAITVCRIVFAVDFMEKAPQAEVEPFDGILFESVSDTGEILIDI